MNKDALKKQNAWKKSFEESVFADQEKFEKNITPAESVVYNNRKKIAEFYDGTVELIEEIANNENRMHFVRMLIKNDVDEYSYEYLAVVHLGLHDDSVIELYRRDGGSTVENGDFLSV